MTHKEIDMIPITDHTANLDATAAPNRRHPTRRHPTDRKPQPDQATSLDEIPIGNESGYGYDLHLSGYLTILESQCDTRDTAFISDPVIPSDATRSDAR